MKQKNNLLTSLVLLLLIFRSVVVCADGFKGRVLNAETGDPLPNATVNYALYLYGGSQTGYLQTDSTGCYVYYPELQGKLIFTYSMIGFKSAKKVNYALGPGSEDIIDMGDVRLRPTELMLQEVKVTAKIPRITMTGDTIVFNPSAFKLKEGARLDELISKLPGVEKRGGALYWNNHPLRLVIDGRNVFGGDGMIGELPADAAAKLKLYDRKSEARRHTGKEDGENDHVLDIQVKPGFLDKWYGDVEAEYRTKDHYRGKLNASRLSAKNPQMLYFQANDVNQKVERTSAGISNSDIDKYGKGQFGAYNYERDWTKKGLEGFDNNHFYITGSLGHADGWGTTYSTHETFLPDADHTFEMTRNRVSNHSLAPKLMADLFAYSDKSNVFKMSATGSFEKLSSTEETDAAKHLQLPEGSIVEDVDMLMGAKPGDQLYSTIVNRSRYYTSADAIKRNLEVNYSWTHYYGKNGWFEVSGATNVSGESRNVSVSRHLEYPIDGYSEFRWQYTKNPQNNLKTWINGYWNHYLSEKFLLRMQNHIEYSREHRERDSYLDIGEAETDGVPSQIDADNNFDYTAKTLYDQVYIDLLYMPTKDIFIMPTVSANFIREDGNLRFGQLDSACVRNTLLLWPSLTFKWNISRANTFQSVVTYKTLQNDLFSMFKWRDTTDPLMVTEGNPDTKNYSRLDAHIRYDRIWLRKQINMALALAYTGKRNTMAKLYRYNSSTGGYSAKYASGGSDDSWQVYLQYDQSLGVYWRIQNNAVYTWSKSRGYMTLVDDDNDLRFNYQRTNIFSDNLRVSYEADKVKFGVVANLDLYGYRYTESGYNSNPITLVYGAWTRLTFSPFEFYVETFDNFRSGYKVTSMNRHRVLCNASLEYSFCRNKCRLTLAANDIFNKDNNFSSDYSAFERSESWYEKLHHYVSLTFAYKFDAKGKK